MAFSCEHCGYRNTDIKHGGGISEHATKITFKVESAKDLNRDIFKSDSSSIEIPELDFSTSAGSMESMYTTIEGLLTKLIDNLSKTNPFGGGGDAYENVKYKDFITTL